MGRINKEKSENRILKIVNGFLSDHKGTTMIEMIVCFALLAIFMVSAATLIGAIASLYYDISGEIYSREVSDIVMGKIQSEIDGAEFHRDGATDGITDPVIPNDNSYIDFYDKTGTHVKLLTNNNVLLVRYAAIIDNINGEDVEIKPYSDWFFDDEMYNGFNVEELKFYRCGKDVVGSDDVSAYRLPSESLSVYDSNVVLVLFKLNSNRYGEYYYYRFVRMNKAPDNFTWTDIGENT